MSNDRFMAMAVPTDFVHIFYVKRVYKVEQGIYFLGEILGVCFSPVTESLIISVRNHIFHNLLKFGRQYK